MKLCKDCKHYTHHKRFLTDDFWSGCSHPEMANPVTGDETSAYNNRAYPELCGYYGNRWEAK